MDSFKVGLNWKGKFEYFTGIIGIIGSIIFFLCLIYAYSETPEKGFEVYFCFSLPILSIMGIIWALVGLSYRIIVNGDEIIIKRAFKKKTKISPKDISSYSSVEKIARVNRYSEISI